MGNRAHTRSLNRLHNSLISTLAWLGITNLILIVVTAVPVSFALDYIFGLPWIVRAMALVGFMVLYIAAVRRNQRRLKVTVPTADLLVTVEKKYPALEGHLFTAVDLGRELNEKTRAGEEPTGLEGELLRRAVKESTNAVETIAVERSLDLGPLRHRVAVTASLTLLIVILGLCFPPTFLLWGQRNILLSTTPWPKRTHFSLEREELVWHHPRRDPVRIEGQVIGRIPRSIDLHITALTETKTVRLLPGPARTGTWNIASEFTSGRPPRGTMVEGRMLSYVMPRATEPFQFYFAGGDNRSRVVDVRVHDRPRILWSQVVLRPPEHSGQEGRTIDNPASEIAAVQGAHVTVSVEADSTIREASARFAKAGRRSIEEIEVTGLRHSFRLMESGFLEISLRGGDWNFEARPLRLAFVAYPDLTPAVTLRIVGENRTVTPEGRIDHVVTATDDYGFTAIGLELRRPAPIDMEETASDGPRTETVTLDLAPWTATITEKAVEVTVARTLNLGIHELVPGTRFTLQAFGVDNDRPGGFKRGESAIETFAVMAPDKLLERLDRMRTEARTELEELAFVEEKIATELSSNQDEAKNDAAQQQADVRRRARDVGRTLSAVREVLQQQRLVGEEELRRHDEEVAQPLADLDEDRLPRSARDLEALLASDRPRDDVQSARKDVQAIADELKKIARRLEGTKKFREIFNRLQIIIELQEDVITDTQREIGS